MIPDDSLVGLWLKKLQIWRDYQQFYHGRKRKNLIDVDLYGYYHYSDIDGIQSSDKNTIIIDNLIESWHSYPNFDQYPTDRKYIILSGGIWDVKKKQLPFCYKPIFHEWCLFEMADTYLSPHKFCFYLDTKIDLDGEKRFLFVSTIGSHRPERDRLVDRLQETFMHDPVLVKYSGECIIGDDAGLDIVTITPGEFDPATPLVGEYYHNVSQTLPIRLYNAARFNLVVETDIDEHDSFFMTEKTIKCLITGMPFVVVATPYFLKHLRGLGFQTYDSLWNEDYDNIRDFDQRINTVIRLCGDLQSLDWKKHQKNLEQIALHNRSQFSRLGDLASREFQQAYSTIKGDWICPDT